MSSCRALVEAGASEGRAKEAAESVVNAREGATKADIAALEASMEGSFRTMAFRLIGAFFGIRALFFAALKLTDSA